MDASSGRTSAPAQWCKMEEPLVCEAVPVFGDYRRYSEDAEKIARLWRKQIVSDADWRLLGAPGGPSRVRTLWPRKRPADSPSHGWQILRSRSGRVQRLRKLPPTWHLTSVCPYPLVCSGAAQIVEGNRRTAYLSPVSRLLGQTHGFLPSRQEETRWRGGNGRLHRQRPR